MKFIRRIEIGLSLIALALFFSTATAQETKPVPLMELEIYYELVAFNFEFDSEGRWLVWEGDVELEDGTTGIIRWWFYQNPIPKPGKVSHYTARWEILTDGEVLLLAGETQGSTTRRVQDHLDSIWRGNGTVTEAYGAYSDWMGRQTHEGGDIISAPPPIFAFGYGTFTFN